MKICHVSILLLFWLLTPCTAEWWIWKSPTESEELDQSQTAFSSYSVMQGGHGIGQTFTPEKTPLERMDFLLYDRDDMRPFSIRLWKWTNDYDTTVSQSPLFEDTVSLTDESSHSYRTFFPRIEVATGEVYYVEFKRDAGDGEWSVYVEWSSTDDPYEGGKLRANNVPRDNADLFFKTYTSVQGAATHPPSTNSNPSLPWSPPAPPGPAVTASNYFETVKAHADNVRWYYTSFTNKYCSQNAICEAFLYKATEEEAYAVNVAIILENAYQYRLQNTNEWCGFTWLEGPGFAYLWVRDSPSLTVENHEHFKWLLVESARQFWPHREEGVMNRSLGGVLTFKLVMELFTDLPEQAEWSAYTDSIWSEFKTYWDTDEDSHHYNWLSWRYILELAMLYDEDDTLWNEAGFKALIARLRESSTPLGPESAQGDTYGWGNEWCTPTWLFGKAALKYNDAHYKWNAYRCFDFQRQYIKNKSLHEAVYAELHSLCFAYFDTDPALPTEPPPAQREQLSARQTVEASCLSSVDETTTTGQSFRPTHSPLVRLDVKINGAAGRNIKLWKWETDYPTTVAQIPLFSVTNFTGQSLYPFLNVITGDLYYAEFSCGGPGQTYSMATTCGTPDRYIDGDMWIAGVIQAGRDLWFQTHTLTPDGSTFTLRQEVIKRRVSELTVPPRAFDWAGYNVPDKLILRSGYGVDDLCVVVNLLCGAYGHSQLETGAILSITDDGSIIYADGAYADESKADKDHSMPVVRRHWGGTFRGQADRVDVEHFADYRKASVAHLGWNSIRGWNFRQRRLLYFVKDRFMIVRDCLTTEEDITASFGSMWHAHDQQGADAYQREPLGINGWLYHNPERYALFYTVPQAGREQARWKVDYNDNPPAAPYIMYQKFAGNIVSNQSVWSDTVVLPHGAEMSSAEAAAKIDVMVDDGTNLAVQVTVGDEVWIVVDNPSGNTLTAVGLHTDASYLIAREQSGNTPYYLLARNASFVQVGDIEKAWPVKTTVEIGGYPTPVAGCLLLIK